MIHSQDRSGWIGASDTVYVVGNWRTKSFAMWWLEKLGLRVNNYTNRYMQAGTNYEHKILDALGFPVRKDHQIKIRPLRLRVNLDGDTPETIYEIKTHRAEKPFVVTRNYYNQVQVEMYAKRCERAYIVSYGLTEEDYRNYFNAIDPARMGKHLVQYDADFIDRVYLPRLRYLAKCLIARRWPDGSAV